MGGDGFPGPGMSGSHPVTRGVRNSAPDSSLVIVLCGPPASGKGTQAALLAGELDAGAVSTGRLIREQQRLGTPVGRLADECLERGELLPDEPVLALMEAWLGEGRRRMIFDGFPRTIGQARWLESRLERERLELTAVIWLRVRDQVLIERTRRRWSCAQCGASLIGPVSDDHPPACEACGTLMMRRSDDEVKTLARRLDAWNREEPALRDHYCRLDQWISVEADLPADELCRRILGRIRQRKQADE